MCNSNSDFAVDVLTGLCLPATFYTSGRGEEGVMSASEEDLTWYFPRADTASFVQLNVVLCDWILILK